MGGLPRLEELRVGPAVAVEDRFALGLRLPPPDDDVAVGRVELHQERLPPGVLAGHERRARAAEEVEDVLATAGGVLDRPRGEFDRLLGQVDHGGGVHLPDFPGVDGIARPVELVPGPFPPAVEAPLVVAHVVLPRQDRVLLHPDDRLREVESRGLQRRRVVRAVRVAAPDVEARPGLHRVGEIPEPRQQHPLEVGLGDEVVQQRPVLRAHLPGRLRLARVAGEVEGLVVRRGERRQPRRDGVVRARLDLDVVGRVGVHELDARPAEQALDVRAGGGIPAEQPVVAEHPEVTPLRDGVVHRLRRDVLVNLAHVGVRDLREQAIDVLVAEAHAVDGVLRPEFREQPREDAVIPLGEFGAAVQRDGERGRVEARHLEFDDVAVGPAEGPHRHQPPVAGNDAAGAALDYKRLGLPEAAERRDDGVEVRLRVGPGVRRIGSE